MTRASVSARNPRALALCDRCQFRYNHDELSWQFQWVGPQLRNLRILVCKSCLDVPQEQLRTVILPADPVAIDNPRPEPVATDFNPNSPIGQSADASLAGTNIGTLINGGGTWAAFDGNLQKYAALSAHLPISISGYNNWVGKDWGAQLGGQFSRFATEIPNYAVTSFTATAPLDSPFVGMAASYTADTTHVTADITTITADNDTATVSAAAYRFQGSVDGSTWATLASGTTQGTVAESITVTVGGGLYRYHRFVLNGDGVNPVAIAQLAMDTGVAVLVSP